MLKNQLYRLRLLGVVFFYFLAATFTFIDQLSFLNEWDLGVNQEYWGSNIGFLSSVMFWFNMFLYSILPVLIATLAIKDRWITYCSYALPLYWGFLLFLSITSTRSQSEQLLPDLKYFIYGLLFISTLVILIKIIMIIFSLRVEETLDDLEQFKTKALKKLSILNPEVNQKLLQNLLGDHGQAFNLILAANLEEDEEQKQRLIRLALNEISNAHGSIKDLEKRLQRVSTFTDFGT